jgi:O-antigen ligase
MPTSITRLFNWSILLLKSGVAWFGLIVAIIACLSILANDGYFLIHGALTINAILLIVGVLLAILPGISSQKSFAGALILLPLSAGMSQQIDALLGISILVLPNAGLDVVAGFFLGYFVKLLSKRQFSLQDFRLPWPINLLLLTISLSTALAIIRNIRQSATETSIFGLLFNLMHFRPIGWHDDYMPIADWIAYGTAGALIVTLLTVLKEVENPNRLIFSSFAAGLLFAFLMGLLQSITGLGLAPSMYEFRRDSLGFAAIGFQPDIHAFAGHMLLGAVGLWAYFQTCRGRFERAVLLAVVGFSWIGLLISKSRASLLIAICASLTVLLIYIWYAHRRWFYYACGAITVMFSGLIATLIFNSDTFATYPIFSWLVEPIQLIKNKEFTSLSVLGGASGSRFEIWSAAFNMIKAFPFMGVGQGNFYHLSADIAFSKSHFMALNGGENAHNYFLQTFAELGLVGIIACILVFAVPFANIQNRKLLLPAGLGVFALFLGNVYSHSFLVRENLLLCAVLIGLMYHNAFIKESIKSYSFAFIEKQKAWKNLSIILLLVLGLASAHEVYSSFYTKIFEIGVDCFKSRPLTDDGWTSGIYEIKPPASSDAIELKAWRPKTMFSTDNFSIRIDILGRNGLSEDAFNRVLKLGERYTLQDISTLSENSAFKNVLVMRLSNCFTPRNLGLNTDGRILGIQIQ